MWDHKLVFARYGFKLLSRLISHKDPKFAKKVLDEGCIDKFTKHLSDSDPSILTEIFNSFAHLIKSIFQLTIYLDNYYTDKDYDFLNRGLEILNIEDSKFIEWKSQVMNFFWIFAENNLNSSIIDYLVNQNLLESICQIFEANLSNSLVFKSLSFLDHIFQKCKVEGIKQTDYVLKFNELGGFERAERGLDKNQNKDIKDLWTKFNSEYSEAVETYIFESIE